MNLRQTESEKKLWGVIKKKTIWTTSDICVCVCVCICFHTTFLLAFLRSVVPKESGPPETEPQSSDLAEGQ